MRVLYDDAQKDEALKEWFRGVDGYTRKVISSPVLSLSHGSRHKTGSSRAGICARIGLQ